VAADYRDPAWPTTRSGCRRIVLHLFDTRKELEAFVSAEGGGSEDFNDPWEARGYTDDVDDIWVCEAGFTRDWPWVGTVDLVRHEGRHILLQGKAEDPANDDREHHPWWHFCVGVGHGLRFRDAHDAGFPKHLAGVLVRRARDSPKGAYGARHAYVDVLESYIQTPKV
jgi:hypothetical protein